MDLAFVALIAVVSGALLNTIAQFLSAILKSATPISFDQKYWASFALSMITTVFVSLSVFMNLPIPENVPTLYVVIPALLSGYAINNGANLALDTYQKNQLTTKKPDGS